MQIIVRTGPCAAVIVIRASRGRSYAGQTTLSGTHAKGAREAAGRRGREEGEERICFWDDEATEAAFCWAETATGWQARGWHGGQVSAYAKLCR